MEKQDGKEWLDKHRKVIKQKRFLNLIYVDFYKEIKSFIDKSGKSVEFGSGAGFIKEVIPNAITSDLIKGEGIDLVFSATNLPFKENTVNSFLMLNVFHHIKNPEKALSEMQRCLKSGGRVVMIEPYNSLWGGFIYRFLHQEHFEPRATWKVKGKGRMSDSNTALPWIVFVRDRAKFEKKYPKLKIIKVSPHTPFSYLVSGGLKDIQFLPTVFYPILKLLEKLLSPLNSMLGMFVTVVIEKK